MTNRDLDHWIAEHVMGWHRFSVHSEDGQPKLLGDQWLTASSNFGASVSKWRPSTDLNAAHAMEERLREMGLVNEYNVALVHATKEFAGPYSLYLFSLIHATARQRCKAAYEVLCDE